LPNKILSVPVKSGLDNNFYGSLKKKKKHWPLLVNQKMETTYDNKKPEGEAAYEENSGAEQNTAETADQDPNEDAAEQKDEKKVRIFVANLPRSYTEEECRDFLGKFAKIEEIYLIPDYNSRQFKGQVKVLFSGVEDRNLLIENIKSEKINDVELRVEIANSKEQTRQLKDRITRNSYIRRTSYDRRPPYDDRNSRRYDDRPYGDRMSRRDYDERRSSRPMYDDPYGSRDDYRDRRDDYGSRYRREEYDGRRDDRRDSYGESYRRYDDRDDYGRDSRRDGDDYGRDSRRDGDRYGRDSRRYEDRDYEYRRDERY
jgi:RNA recognition motif-containing protein